MYVVVRGTPFHGSVVSVFELLSHCWIITEMTGNRCRRPASTCLRCSQESCSQTLCARSSTACTGFALRSEANVTSAKQESRSRGLMLRFKNAAKCKILCIGATVVAAKPARIPYPKLAMFSACVCDPSTSSAPVEGLFSDKDRFNQERAYRLGTENGMEFFRGKAFGPSDT